MTLERKETKAKRPTILVAADTKGMGKRKNITCLIKYRTDTPGKQKQLPGPLVFIFYTLMCRFDCLSGDIIRVLRYEPGPSYP